MPDTAPLCRRNDLLLDDRLATVLRHRASGREAARTQFRQLLDLLGSRTQGSDESLLAAAWLRLAALAEQIPASERAALIREPGYRFRNPSLAAHLAEDEPEVAAAALARADLREPDWLELIPALPVRARGFLRLQKGLPTGVVALLDRLGVHDRGLPVPVSGESDEEPEEPPAPRTAPSIAVRAPRPARDPIPLPANDATPPRADEKDSQIGALVRRIEQYRQARNAPPAADRDDGTDAPRLPLGDRPDPREIAPIAAFAFTCDAAGRIDWAEPGIAPMVVGTRLLAERKPLGRARDPLATRFAGRQPLVRLPVTLHGAQAIAGEWIVDAAPRFVRDSGRFYGFAGRFRRKPAPLPAPEIPSEGDQIRQLLHELRTPVNAIQGFAEVIQQQLFGPTPHEYRALAASIASDSARMLAGFDELDRLAKLETGALDLDAGSADFAAAVRETVRQLQGVLSPRMSGIDLTEPTADLTVALAENELEALVWRVLATLAGACGAGQQLGLALSQHDGQAVLTGDLPEAIGSLDDPFEASGKAGGGAISAGIFGAGFALRLARAEAEAAGGSLSVADGRLVVTLPLLTALCADHSVQGEERADETA